MLISIFLGISHINNTLQGKSANDLITKMAKNKIFGDENFLQRLFKF